MYKWLFNLRVCLLASYRFFSFLFLFLFFLFFKFFSFNFSELMIQRPKDKYGLLYSDEPNTRTLQWLRRIYHILDFEKKKKQKKIIRTKHKESPFRSTPGLGADKNGVQKQQLIVITTKRTNGQHTRTSGVVTVDVMETGFMETVRIEKYGAKSSSALIAMCSSSNLLKRCPRSD